jgi:chromosome segregation ATPase
VEQTQSESLNSTLANKQLELKVLREHIKASEKQLATLKLDIPKTEKKIKVLQDVLRELGKDKLKAEEDLSRVKKKTNLDILEAAKIKDSLNFGKRQINAEIKARTQYLAEQEGLIETSVERGNEQLKIIRYQVEEFENNKQEVENEIYESKKILEQLGHEISNAAIELGAMQDNNKEQVSTLREESRKIQAKVDDAKLELQATTEETQTKLNILRGKEESIVARENAIRLQTEDLARRERRLNSAERLYE